jgi:hypothetical protein
MPRARRPSWAHRPMGAMPAATARYPGTVIGAALLWESAQQHPERDYAVRCPALSHHRATSAASVGCPFEPGVAPIEYRGDRVPPRRPRRVGAMTVPAAPPDAVDPEPRTWSLRASSDTPQVPPPDTSCNPPSAAHSLVERVDDSWRSDPRTGTSV